MPLTEKQIEQARAAAAQLRAAGCRVTVDERSEKVGAKIRNAQLEKIPYMLILGPKEAESGMVSVRSRSAGDQGVMSLEALIAKVQAEIASRGLESAKQA